MATHQSFLFLTETASRRALSTFVFFASTNCSYFGNVVAGSFDTGFMIITELLITTGSDAAEICPSKSSMEAYTGTIPSPFKSPKFYNNEAVGCRNGLQVYTNSQGLCIVLTRFKAWRNAGFGMFYVYDIT